MSLNSPSPRNSRREFRGVNPGYTSPVGTPLAPDRRSRAFRGTGNVWRPTNVPPSRGRLPAPAPRRLPLPGALGALVKTANFVGNLASMQQAEGYVFPMVRPPDGPGFAPGTGTWGCSHPGSWPYGPVPTYADNVYTSPFCWGGLNGSTEPIYPPFQNQAPGPNTRRITWIIGQPAAAPYFRNVSTRVHQWALPVPGLSPVFPPYYRPARVIAVPVDMPVHYHRPQPLPVPVAGGAVPRNPLIRPGLGFEFTPGAPPKVVKVPTSRPPGRTHEGKANGAAAVALAMVVDAFNAATEVADVLAIFWDNLPVKERTFWDTMVRMMQNPSLWDQVDWDQMVLDLIANEVEDQAIGRLNGLKRKLRTEWGEPIYGGAFQGP